MVRVSRSTNTDDPASMVIIVILPKNGATTASEQTVMNPQAISIPSYRRRRC